MLAQADRHPGDRTQVPEAREVFKTSVHLRAVIHARHQHQLRVEIDAGIFEPLQIVENPPGLGISHQCNSQIGIGRMHRDVERADVLLLDSGPVLVAQVGERDK